MEITTTNLEDAGVQSPTIRFSVDKSWLTDNGVNKENVKLVRYSGGWQTLVTNQDGEDATTVTYTARTPGFSTFAIIAEEPEVVSVCGDGICGIGEDCPADCAIQVCTPGTRACDGNQVTQCSSDGTSFEVLQTCTYGCQAATCQSAPVTTPQADSTPIVVGLAAIAVILALVLVKVFVLKKPKKRRFRKR